MQRHNRRSLRSAGTAILAERHFRKGIFLLITFVVSKRPECVIGAIKATNILTLLAIRIPNGPGYLERKYQQR